jgi:hypothetical protein
MGTVFVVADIQGDQGIFHRICRTGDILVAR